MLASRPSVFSHFHRWFSDHLSAFCHSIHAAFTLLCRGGDFARRWAASIYILSSLVVLMLRRRYPASVTDSLHGLRGSGAVCSYFLTLPGGLVLDRLLGAKRARSAEWGSSILGTAFHRPAAAAFGCPCHSCSSDALFKPNIKRRWCFLQAQ